MLTVIEENIVGMGMTMGCILGRRHLKRDCRKWRQKSIVHCWVGEGWGG